MSFPRILFLMMQTWFTGFAMAFALVHWFQVHQFPHATFMYSIMNIGLIIFLLSTYKFEDKSVLEKERK